jgi:hypothetical protein
MINKKSDPAGADPAQQNSGDEEASRFATFAATQAAGDGIEGDVKKKDKNDAEKLGAQMPDRK